MLSNCLYVCDLENLCTEQNLSFGVGATEMILRFSRGRIRLLGRVQCLLQMKP